MRRVLVIALILLFPLNLFALAMSASLMQTGDASVQAGHAAQHAPATVADGGFGFGFGFDCASACDIDPDEPPGNADLHDIVNHDALLRVAGLSAAAPPCPGPRRHCHSIPPPRKPPRA